MIDRTNFRRCLTVVVLLFVVSVSLAATPQLPEKDRTRLAEVYRLADSLGNHLWKGWSAIPFPILLVTDDTEFLLRHPSPDTSFARAGYDSLLRTEIFARPRIFPITLLASFPFDGVPTTVIGQAENTESATSTPWMITLLHEHFHQFQTSQADYFQKVANLGLAGDDKTGMWMLNYPFPYDSANVQAAFNRWKIALGDAVNAPDSLFAEKFKDYKRIRREFMSSLREPDRTYLSFQLWQEGVARYTEFRVAEWAAEHFTPSATFVALPDYKPVAQTFDRLNKVTHRGPHAVDLGQMQRLSFYIIGSSEAYVLERANSHWRENYFQAMLNLDPYFEN